ncbi:hypothetical protein O181_079965 [Austropuccinia psidii MF-1]|uniref:Uncharacterized protein n=1 Tax=Austropuccinia psidii MF-1 TaxID=1389203 RepID=A0A9Q3IIF8_9BASI|nr:hypothetical protein [Austropuccinia psidii MF-1]
MKPMSKEDQESPTSYVKFLISVENIYLNDSSLIPCSNPSQIASTCFTLYWCSGAQHFKVGATFATMEITLLELHMAYKRHIQIMAIWPYLSVMAKLVV